MDELLVYVLYALSYFCLKCLFYVYVTVKEMILINRNVGGQCMPKSINKMH